MWKDLWIAAGKTAALAAASLALFACGQNEAAEALPAGAVMRLSDQFTGEFNLIDHNGAPRSDDDFKGKTAVVYFGFATCPDVCPMALGTLSAALNELSDKERAELAALFITVDPARDTPAALKEYLSFNPDIVGLTGAPEAVGAAKAAFKVYAKPRALPGSAAEYTMDHTSLFYVVDRSGQPQWAIKDTVNAQELADLLRRAIKGRYA